MSENLSAPSEGNFLFYQTEDGITRVRVLLDGGTVWLSQRLIAELYGKSVPTVNEHIENIYDEAELDSEATIRKFRIVQTEGGREVSRLVDLYNLDIILAVGYRIRSPRGTQFRRWAKRRRADEKELAEPVGWFLSSKGPRTGRVRTWGPAGHGV